MVDPGFIYVLINPSMPGIVKIGKSKNNPENRASELSSATGVPTPFVVAYYSQFQDCSFVESQIHEQLDNRRISSNREFFQVPLKEVIDLIQNVEQPLDIDQAQHDQEIIQELEAVYTLEKSSVTTDPSGDSVYLRAKDFYFGYGDNLEDREEAFRLFNLAANFGCLHAYWKIGKMLSDGDGVREDQKEALQFFKKGADLGDGRCWAEMGMLYFKIGHIENDRKCWKNYFESQQFQKNIVYTEHYYGRAHYGFSYLHSSYSPPEIIDNLNVEFIDYLVPISDEIISAIERWSEYFENEGNMELSTEMKELSTNFKKYIQSK